MADASSNLALPFIQQGQAQEHVIYNEAVPLLDALVQCHVVDTDRTSPPAVPSDGDRHLVAVGATGDWAGQDQKLAVRIDGA